MAAVDTCVLLNEWELAVDLAQKHNFVQIEGLLTKSPRGRARGHDLRGWS